MESRKTQLRHPEEEASFVSRVMLWWIIPLQWKGWRRPLQQEDLHQVRNEDQSSKFTERLEAKLEQEMDSAKRGIRLLFCYSHLKSVVLVATCWTQSSSSQIALTNLVALACNELQS